MRFVAFSEGTIFLLSRVSFVPVLKLSRLGIHASKWIQYSTTGLFLCGSKCGCLLVLISFSENFFACVALDVISLLLRPSLDIKELKFLN